MSNNWFMDSIGQDEIDALLSGIGVDDVITSCNRVLSTVDVTHAINSYAGDILRLISGDCTAKEAINILTSIILEVELMTLTRKNEHESSTT